MRFQEIRETADRVRGIPLEEVLLLDGALRDRSDRAKWHTRQGVLSVTGMKFMNWNRGKGGGGAIDLAIHLGNFDFKAAVDWLSRSFPLAGAGGQALKSPGQVLRLPQRDEGKIGRVRIYLVQKRRLPSVLVENAIGSGRLYADVMGNAVFLLLGKENVPVGAELRGTGLTPWRGLASGSLKDRGYFSVPRQEAQAIVLCESAIDALSCLAINPDFLCISTAGARSNPLWLPALLRDGCPVFCGFDADRTGDETARSMIERFPSIGRLRPPLHDWNDVLKAKS